MYESIDESIPAVPAKTEEAGTTPAAAAEEEEEEGRAGEDIDSNVNDNAHEVDEIPIYASYVQLEQ